VIWHNDDLLEQSVEDNLKVLRGPAPDRVGSAQAREALSG
jgi:hypothetical protein